MVPRRGLEPPRIAPLVPETSASTSSATWARWDLAYTRRGNLRNRPRLVNQCSIPMIRTYDTTWFLRPPTPKDARQPHPKDWRGEDPNLELERSRYADPIASRELLLKHLADAPEPLSRRAPGEAPRLQYRCAARRARQAPGGDGARWPGAAVAGRLHAPPARPSASPGGCAAARAARCWSCRRTGPRRWCSPAPIPDA